MPPSQDPYGYGYGPPPMMVAPPMGLVRCPYCTFDALPTARNRVSQTGWIVFSVLLVLCFPLCWIGLLIRETVTTCVRCNSVLSGPT